MIPLGAGSGRQSQAAAPGHGHAHQAPEVIIRTADVALGRARRDPERQAQVVLLAVGTSAMRIVNAHRGQPAAGVERGAVPAQTAARRRCAPSDRGAWRPQRPGVHGHSNDRIRDGFTRTDVASAASRAQAGQRADPGMRRHRSERGSHPRRLSITGPFARRFAYWDDLASGRPCRLHRARPGHARARDEYRRGMAVDQDFVRVVGGNPGELLSACCSTAALSRLIRMT